MKLKKAVILHRVLQYIIFLCVILFGFIGFIGCGGGGGDGGPQGPQYKGLTTQAQITATNAELFAAGAFGAGRAGSAFSGTGASGTGAVEKSTEGNINSFRTFSISQALMDAALQVDPSSIPGPPFIGTSESDTVPGPCGGTVSYTIQYNDSTGAFSGTFTFNNFCDTGVTLNGSTTVTGTINLFTSTIENINFHFSSLSDGSSTLSGDMNIDFAVSPIRIDFNTLLEVNATKIVYWAEDYVIYLSESSDTTGNYVDVTISSGNYYEPDYGYVSVTTPTTFRVYYSDTWPSSGVLVATGTGNTKVRLTAINNTQCQIDADLDGNDIYESDIGTYNWPDL
jgi:hypothetical protein